MKSLFAISGVLFEVAALILALRGSSMWAAFVCLGLVSVSLSFDEEEKR